jgi:hypothetical protein
MGYIERPILRKIGKKEISKHNKWKDQNPDNVTTKVFLTDQI